MSEALTVLKVEKIIRNPRQGDQFKVTVPGAQREEYFMSLREALYWAEKYLR